VLAGVHGYEVMVCGSVKRFRGGLVFKAHRWLYHSTLGLRVIKKRKVCESFCEGVGFGIVLRDGGDGRCAR